MSHQPSHDNLPEHALLAASVQTEPDARPDEALHRFAAIARAAIRVPAALVSLIDDGRRALSREPEPEAAADDSRETKSLHSLCQHIITAGLPMIANDVRPDPRIARNPAITELGVVAYAGEALTDADGQILGILIVIDHASRSWTAAELELLIGLAAACSAALRLQITAARTATLLNERSKFNTVLANTTLLLAACEDLSAATTIGAVTEAVGRFLHSAVAPAYVSLGIAYTAGIQRHIHVSNVQHPEWQSAWLHDVETGGSPMLRSFRDNTALYYSSTAALAAEFPHHAPHLVAAGRTALACLPLPGPDGPIGVITFWWDNPHSPDTAERITLTTLAGYTALAVQRVLQLQDRIDAATTLQQAMLTALPPTEGLQLAARYHAAHAGDQVGGDWYDAFQTTTGATIIVIGDVAGHDITAAARMGQLRTTLRALGHDRDEKPDQLLTRTDANIQQLNLDILASAVVARLEPNPLQPATFDLSWSTAGHPPPLLQHADGSIDILTGSDLLLGADHTRPRCTRIVTLPPGATLLLYTDGLVELREIDMRQRISRLRDLLASLHGHPLDRLLDTLVESLTSHNHEDDVAVIACRNVSRLQ
ncbi:GAF domain-containing SpoIIE family protein phosphatase [Dactylosporangium sp. CS-047395]|uniref:GAF domain-containing SpoIIE family protein phosphatase n=1 Tax=Dactylosporangium sp. CS-047395 TaxID=3239936 RepID=UPI003D8E4621